MLDLYKDLILDHGLNPRNKYIMSNFTNFATGFNYFCGDKVNIYIDLLDDTISKISFYGDGCSVSLASASLLTVLLKSKSIVEVKSFFIYFNSIIKDEKAICYDNKYYYLNTLANVRKYPTRVKCATLVWHTLTDALKINQ